MWEIQYRDLESGEIFTEDIDDHEDIYGYLDDKAEDIIDIIYINGPDF